MGARERRVLGVKTAPQHVESSPDENSKFRVGDDLYILLDEVLNNSIRALLIYDDFTGRFTDIDAIALASVLRYNTSIISVNFSGVDIGDHAVSLLCDALARSHVRSIDLSNTYLADESGIALAALAQCNPNIRTVVVDDTLISEEIMDEIDLACQNNETLYELGPPEKIDPQRPRFCVYNCFGVCPNGEYCEQLHRSITLIGRDSSGATQSKARQLELPPVPQLGASWKAPRKLSVDDSDDDDDLESPQFRPRLFPIVSDRGAREPAHDSKGGELRTLWITLTACVAVLCAAVAYRVSRS